jgi:ribosome biogenesis protein Tsr3
MNLYIINDVLYDYTAGMCVIAAESMPHCEQIFIEEFSWGEQFKQYNENLQKEFNEAAIKVIENVPYEKEEVVSYVYGGG